MKLGGFICMSLLIPGFVFCWVLPSIASHLLFSNGAYLAQLAQMTIAAACFCMPSLGRAGTVLAAAITASLHTSGAGSASIIGSSIWFAMTLVNWGHHFSYSPRFTRFIFRMDMTSYFDEPCELRGAVDTMGTSRTLYMFHPHGITTAGFSCNGIFSKAFHERTMPPERRNEAWKFREWPGTIFLLTAGLREPSHFFKIICDLTGRMESSTRHNMKRYMQAGRNLAILPGGFEEATLFEYGLHRVAMKKRKGIIKYALQHGYTLHPIYTFGECRSYVTFTRLKSLRLWLNAHQLPCVAFWGDWRVPIFPRRDAPCLSYVGAPLKLPRIEEPTMQQVDEWHAAYIAALERTFEQGKADVGEPDALLEVW